MTRIFFWNTLQSTYWSPYEELHLSIFAHLPEYIAISKVMEYVNVIFLHCSFHNVIGAILPDVVVCAYASQTFFPEPCPLGPIVIEEMNMVVFGIFSNPRFNGRLVTLTS